MSHFQSRCLFRSLQIRADRCSKLLLLRGFHIVAALMEDQGHLALIVFDEFDFVWNDDGDELRFRLGIDREFAWVMSWPFSMVTTRSKSFMSEYVPAYCSSIFGSTWMAAWTVDIRRRRCALLRRRSGRRCRRWSSLLHQAEAGHRSQRFADGSGLKQGLRVYRSAAEVAYAESAGPFDLAVVEDSDADAGHVEFLHASGERVGCVLVDLQDYSPGEA